jgi:hypothetical protein
VKAKAAVTVPGGAARMELREYDVPDPARTTR